jgi:hypothetical protein
MFKKFISLLMIIVILTVTVIPSSPLISLANAGIENDMENFLNDLGVMANAQMPGAFKAGGRNIFSGGSMSMRIDNTIPPTMTFQPPSLRVSCSGMDFNAGLISILNLDMIQQILEQGGTSLAWGLLIGLAYSLPTVSNVLEKIQKYTRWMQMLEGNICEIGKNIGTSLGESIGEGFQHDKKASDVASGAAGTMVEAIKDIWNNPDQFAKSTRGNLVYDALTDLHFASDETYKAAMAIFGTVEWFPQTDETDKNCTPKNPEEVNVIFRVHSPTMAIKSESIINAFVNGGKIDTYNCSVKCGTLGIMNTTCTGLKPTTVTLSGTKQKIYDTLYSAIQHLANGQMLTPDELAYLNMPVIPNFSDLILFLTTNYRRNIDIRNDVNIIATFYSYWMVNYFLSYINDAIHKSKPILLSSKKVPANITSEIEKFYATYRKASTELNDVFRKQTEIFVRDISRSQELANISINRGKELISNLGTLNLGSSLSNFNK